MAGPWEKYAKQPDTEAAPAGPWTKYQSEAKPQGPSESESGIRGALSGITASLDDEFTGVVGAAGRLAGYKNLGSWKPFDPNSHLEAADQPLSAAEIVEAYRQNLDAIRGEQRQDMATNPKATIAGNLAGALVSPVGKLAAPQKVFGPLSKGQALIQAAKTSALQGAAFSAGSSDADLTKGEVGKFAQDTAIGAGLGYAIPPALAGAGYVAGKGAQAAGWTGKKLLGSLGVNESNIPRYLAERAEINASPEFAQVKTHVDDAMAQLSKAVDDGKVSVAQAKEALTDLKAQVRNQLTDAKVDAREAVRRTEDLFKDASSKLIQPLKDHRAPTELAHQVVSAVDELKRGISEKSGLAWQTLEQSDKALPTMVVKGELTKAINSLKVGGKDGAIVGEASQAAMGSLQKLRTQLDSLPDRLSMPQVKEIIQSLDKDINWTGAAGEYMDAASREKLGVRRGMDSYLKRNIPEYAEAMGPVSKDSELLGEVSRAFGDERKAVGRLGQVASPKGALDRQALAQLEQTTGKPGAFTGPIDQYTRAQSILKDPQAVEQMKRALPEYSAYRQAMAKLAKMRPDWTREQLEQALSKSKEARALSMAESQLSKAESTLEPVSRLRPGSTQSQVESFGKPRGPSIEDRKALDALEKITGRQFVKPLEQRAILESFENARANGSRNTLFWGAIGFAMGGLPGAAGGAAFGHQVVDRYGPKLGKAILDGIGRIRETPSVQTIRGLNLPANVKTELEREFNVYMIARNKGAALPAQVAQSDDSAQRSPATGEAAWVSRGLKNLGITDQATVDRLRADPNARKLLIEASDLDPSSRAMNTIKDRLKKGILK